jgi:hypothetical protein
MKLPAPEGFSLPDGAKEGEEFDAVGTFVLSEGSLTLKAVDGMSLPADPDEEDEEMEEGDASPMADEGDDFMSAVEKGLSA